MKTPLLALAAAAMIGATATAATIQRDPAYEAAREAGKVGEQPDGYLGIVGSATPELRAMVNNINIQRKAAYTQKAGDGATVEQMAFVTGCRLIANTQPGEMYRTPGGEWRAREAGQPPVRDSRCV